MRSSTTKTNSDGWSTDYYELPPGARELQDLIEYRDMNFSVGNIFKAAYRLGRKEGADTLYDLRKIMWYAEREIARLSSNEDNAPMSSNEYCLFCDERHTGLCPYEGTEMSEYNDLYEDTDKYEQP